jgi:hypothetical protein
MGGQESLGVGVICGIKAIIRLLHPQDSIILRGFNAS